MPPLDLAAGQIYNFNPFASGSSVMGNRLGGSPFGNVISQNPSLAQTQTPASQLTPSIGGGSTFTTFGYGGGGGPGGAGPAGGAGQIGSAGAPGNFGGSLTSLGGGLLAPGFGAVKAGVQLATDPNFTFSNAVNQFSLGLLGEPYQGQGYPANPNAITDPNVIANTAVNPASQGLANAAIANLGQMTQDTSPAQQAAMQAALDALSASGLGVGGFSSDTAGSTDSGGFGGPGGAAAGTSGGFGPGGGYG